MNELLISTTHTLAVLETSCTKEVAGHQCVEILYIHLEIFIVGKIFALYWWSRTANIKCVKYLSL